MSFREATESKTLRGEDVAIVEDLGGVEKNSICVVAGEDNKYSVGEEGAQGSALHVNTDLSSLLGDIIGFGATSDTTFGACPLLSRFC